MAFCHAVIYSGILRHLRLLCAAGDQAPARAVSANAAVDDSQNKHCHGQDTESIFIKGIVPASDPLLSSKGYRVLHGLLSPDPGKHDPGQTGAQRADIDGYEVHPAGNNTLDAQRHHNPNNTDDGNCFGTAEMQVILKGVDCWRRLRISLRCVFLSLI